MVNATGLWCEGVYKMIYLWYDGMTQETYAIYEGKRLKLNATQGVHAYVDELCEGKTDGCGASKFPYTQEVWAKLRSFGVEVVEATV